MSFRREQFVNGEYYHILNRGIESREIFLDDSDYQRFCESLREFNISVPLTIRQSRQNRQSRSPTPALPAQPAFRLVEIICFCLLPNHFHLLLKQLRENGIRDFMRKLGTGYTNYFNLKRERTGHLFQGTFKAVHINKESQFLHITRYVHLNVLDLLEPKWREGKINDWEKAKKFLENYPYSSYPIFIGKRSSDFCAPEIFKEIFKTSKEYEIFLEEWAERDYRGFKNLVLE
jgi:putative transposase